MTTRYRPLSSAELFGFPQTGTVKPHSFNNELLYLFGFLAIGAIALAIYEAREKNRIRKKFSAFMDEMGKKNAKEKKTG